MSVVKARLAGYKIALKRVEYDDIEMLRRWRNSDKIKAFMLTQASISAEQQAAWFERLQTSRAQIHYVIYYKNESIGAANIRALDSDDVHTATIIEPGIYIYADQYRSNLLAFAPTLLLNDYCFSELSSTCLQARVKADNRAALKYNRQLGYEVVESTASELVTMRLTQAEYQRASQRIKGLLSRN